MTPLLDPREVSKVLRVSLSTVRRLTAAGDLPFVRVSDRRPRYRASDITAFVAHRKSDGAFEDDDGAEATAPTVTTSGVEAAGHGSA
jgi:excisionase family DNA binding protein